jgi:hypothetical protein
VIQITKEAIMNNLFYEEEIIDIEFDFGIYIESKEVIFY